MDRKIMVLYILVVVLATAVVGLTITMTFIIAGNPRIPSDEGHLSRTTCFECHETGKDDAPQFPAKHLEMRDEGKLADNVVKCLECHLRQRTQT